jgi:hypothetical protein
MMGFQPSIRIPLAIICMVVGGVQFMMGWSYAEASKREATAVGALVRVTHGRSSTYVFQFRLNGALIRGDTSTCRTALTAAGCSTGASVLVYYDPDQTAGPMLQEYGAAGRARIFMGGWMLFFGLILITWGFFFRSRGGDTQSSGEQDDEGNDGERDVLHIAPGE